MNSRSAGQISDQQAQCAVVHGSLGLFDRSNRKRHLARPQAPRVLPEYGVFYATRLFFAARVETPEAQIR
jgi:hypothetical protein